MYHRLWGVYGGSTGIMSSSEDITKWMLMQLNEGRNEKGAVVIREEDLSHTHSPQTAIRSSTIEKFFYRPKAPFTVTEATYAMGWKNGFYKGNYEVVQRQFKGMNTPAGEVAVCLSASMLKEIKCPKMQRCKFFPC